MKEQQVPPTVPGTSRSQVDDWHGKSAQQPVGRSPEIEGGTAFTYPMDGSESGVANGHGSPLRPSVPAGPGTDAPHVLPSMPSTCNGATRTWTCYSPYSGSSDEDTECIDMSPAEEGDEAVKPAAGFLSDPEEAHYITTHQIQLCELDHDADGDSGPEPGGWELGESSPCRSLLEYASFDSDGTLEDTQTEGGDSYISTTASDPCPWRESSTDMPSSSAEPHSGTHSESDTPAEEGWPRGWGSSGGPGQVSLSITGAPWAINEPLLREQHSAPAAQRETDMSLCAFRAPEASLGRQQQSLALDQARRQVTAVRRAGCSSGASSAVSELDEADREVRSLTARAFRSLAYPYFEALNFSSSASSTSEQGTGLGQWSGYLDWAGGAAQKELQHKSTGGKGGLGKSNIHIDSVQTSQSLELVVSGRQKEKAATSTGARVVTLSETLSLSHIAASGSQLAWNEAGSVSAPGEGKDKVQLPKEPEKELVNSNSCKLTCSASEPADSMEQGTHKSKFASNLLQNVISKKMQLEQEFKMERGEITDTSNEALSTSLTSKDFEGLKEKDSERGFQRQRSRSRHSECDSEYSFATLEDFGDFVEEKVATSGKRAASPPGDSGTQKSAAVQSTHTEGAGATLRSAAEAAKATLLRSQHSAFRSWKEKEIQKLEQKIMEEKVAVQSKIKIPLGYDGRVEHGDTTVGRTTKLSSLYVPGIQSLPKENLPEKQATKYSASTYAHQTCFKRAGDSKEANFASSTAAARTTQKLGPEAQVCQATFKAKVGADSKGGGGNNPFSIAKLLTPSLARAAEELKNHTPASPSKVELLEKMPQFLVRDVRESKPNKAPGPLHQVRDVRKLMKSSYHPEETGAKGSSTATSPMVITCQAVKNKDDVVQARVRPSSPDTILVHRASGRLPVATIAPNKSGPRMPVVKIVSKACKWRQQQDEKPESTKPAVEQPKESPPPHPTVPGHQVLDKLTAAVKTMEQLYVFDKREWRRRSVGDPAEGVQAGGAQLVGSHVLSLIASEEGRVQPSGGTQWPQGGKGQETISKSDLIPLPRRNSHPGAESSSSKAATNIKSKPASPGRIIPPCKVEKDPSRAYQQQPPSNGGNKNTGNFGGGQRTTHSAAAKTTQQQESSSIQRMSKSPGSRPLPLMQSLSLEEGSKSQSARGPPPSRQYSADFGNYLSMPTKSKVEPAPVTAPSIGSLPPFSAKIESRSPPGQTSDPQGREESIPPTRIPAADHPPPASVIYQQQQPCLTPLLPGGPTTQLIFSPPLTAVPPELLQPQGAQRRLLLDLASGQYFMLDTPTPPARRRLFDPETGQYVDVPVPQQSATPMHLPMSPLALSPGAYGATYMLCPSFVPTTAVIPTLQSQLSHSGSEQSYDMGNYRDQSGQMGETRGFADSPYYMPTGKSTAQTNQQGLVGYPEGKPVISIMSQQQPGPRIIAPPSFDGTTMRFVVEHR
ncbi:uncharacterized protein C4orf54 homolog [Pleurodeles waltl]|uniref:uncharacterized protein C4orf54 homolog n=1 Tax=Pleurodeles waltl TaxID=8319 RepID=UPI0037097A45